MLLRTITRHVRDQNWFAVLVDFVIVVVGVYIGIQVSNWNETRIAHSAEIDFIGNVREDIAQNIVDNEGFIDYLAEVSGHGYRVIESRRDAIACGGQCWSRLLGYFFASQWIDVRTDRTTFEEIKRTGLPRDIQLRRALVRYYGLTEQMPIIAADLPYYRELVRSIIPAELQTYMFDACYGLDGRQQILIEDCPPPVGDDIVRAVVNRLHDNADIDNSLNYWLSTIAIVSKGLADLNVEGAELVQQLDEHLASR